MNKINKRNKIMRMAKKQLKWRVKKIIEDRIGRCSVEWKKKAAKKVLRGKEVDIKIRQDDGTRWKGYVQGLPDGSLWIELIPKDAEEGLMYVSLID